MSGGVDSSVAACLMQRRGYDCMGATMRLYRNEDIGLGQFHTCCSQKDIDDAAAVAFELDIPYEVLDFTMDFREAIIQKFVHTYEAGGTPNPCIDCNRVMKFDKLLNYALEHSYEWVVTGHYARIEPGENGRWLLKKALDPAKDQSYVLYNLTQHQLAHVLFPLGGMSKPDVRKLAESMHFVNARKHDSQDICFVPDGDDVKFMEQYTGKHYPAGDFLDETGRVVAVLAKDNKNGRYTKFEASKGVIVATGGFGANVKLRQEVNTGVFKDYDLGKGIGCTNFQKAAQGSGIMMGKAVGANVIGMSDIQVHPCGTPGTGLMEMIRTSGRNRIFVNTDGNRFVNEGAPRDGLAKAIFAQKGSTYYIVVNHLRYPALDWVDRNGARVGDMIDLGRVVAADTLEELAKKLNMPAENLKKSIANYNDVVAGKAKDPLGFLANNKADKLMTEGPWYACQKVPTLHHTMGGLQINTKAQVLDVNGKVIPGLYAAGETTGGIHGSNRLGGNAICDIMVFGRTAGTSAAKGL